MHPYYGWHTENAINWVHHLTELADKAKAYDGFFDALEEGEREEIR